MKILKNVVLPILIIVFATLYRMQNPEIKIGSTLNLICFIVVYIVAILPLYYLFCKIYPDENNLDFPPQLLPGWSQNRTEEARETRAFRATGYSSIVVFIIGGLLWYYLPIKYTQDELLKNGIEIKTIINSDKRSKVHFGHIKMYNYVDDTGVKHSDFVKDDRLKVGDTITIIYSSKRPKINSVLLEK